MSRPEPHGEAKVEDTQEKGEDRSVKGLEKQEWERGKGTGGRVSSD